MHVQTVVSIENVGYRTCNVCGSYDRCLRVKLSSDSSGVDCATCLSCISKRFSMQLDFEVKTEYTKAQRKRSNKKAKRSEAKTAEETGGRCTGYFPDAGDSRNERFLFEDKTPTAGERKSFRITEEIVLKGRSQAQKAGLTPVFRIHLRNTSIGAMLWDDLINLMEGSE